MQHAVVRVVSHRFLYICNRFRTIKRSSLHGGLGIMLISHMQPITSQSSMFFEDQTFPEVPIGGSIGGSIGGWQLFLNIKACMF